MAESAVFSVLAKLADPLIRALIEESLFLYGVRDEVEWLQRELSWIQCFLIDAEGKRRSRDGLVKNWLREVREVAHQAEDIIDTFTLKKMKKKKRGRIKRYTAFPIDLFSLHMVGTEINGLMAKIKDIKESRERYGLVNLPAETTPSAAYVALLERWRTSVDLNDTTLANKVVGLNVHTEEIAKRLLDPDIKHRSVVSIVGIGGIGKTTLANKVYNNSEIKANFQVFACITVSQDYKVHEILKELARQMMGKTMAELQSCAEVELRQMLRDFLMDKRYLILLDDVWSQDVWDYLIRAALPEVNNGSRVLLTTRNFSVANSISDTILPYDLPYLNDNDSWDLFLNKAFPSYQEEESSSRYPEELAGIGHRLVQKCGGLPLMLEVLGGILSLKEPNSAEWTSVAEHWGSDDLRDCSTILGLSYDNLPHHNLKSCFLYLGVFPEDSVIKAQELIELWIAEGFIPQQNTQLEDTAHAYLEEFAVRSMIQVVDRDWLGSSASVKSFRIHGIFRNLCIREAEENDFFNIYNTTSNINTLQDTINNQGKKLRRLVVHGDISTTTSADLMLPQNLKSILQFGTKPSAIVIPKQVRVIHFVDDRIGDQEFPEMFPKMINNMRLLRYLRLCGYSSDNPLYIQKLCNLQTLHLPRYVSVEPDWLGEIPTIRHLHLDTINASRLGDVRRLTNLQTLDLLIDARTEGWMELVNIRFLLVCKLMEEQVRVFIDSLTKMKHLSELSVYNEPEVIPIDLLSGLSGNTHLRTFILNGPMSVQQLPESLNGFPPHLTTLQLLGSKLAQDPMATLKKLPYLRVLKLLSMSYTGKEMVCTSGGFQRLHELVLSGLKELEEWRVDDGAMPNITVLHISDCEKLRTQHLLSSLKTLLWLNGSRVVL